MKRLLLAIFALVIDVSSANAQAPTRICLLQSDSTNSCWDVGPTNAFPVTPAGASFLNIAGAATTTVKTGAGNLIAIINNKSVASSTITIYDNTAASGTKIGTVTNPGTLLQSQYPLAYNGLVFSTGLTIVTSGADDLTVVYK